MVKASLGPYILGVTMPQPDLRDPDTALGGVFKRMAAKLPTPNPLILLQLQEFIERELEKLFTPISPTEDLSFETWINSRPYPDWRKKELIRTRERIPDGVIKKSYMYVNAFVKDEPYPEFKNARGIYARSDYFKVLFGPLIARIEEDFYNHPAFIKHIPVKDRPAYILNRMEQVGLKPKGTDYTSFESTFVPEVMEATDMVLFKFFYKHFIHQYWQSMGEKLMDENEIFFAWFKFMIRAKRMSGEMATSLFNGSANYFVGRFTTEVLCNYGDVTSIVEGDDCLFQSTSGKLPAKEDFAKVGMNIKITDSNEVNTASFCGLIFDKEDKANIADPYKILSEFAWTSGKYKDCKTGKLLTLLRAKGLSFAYQYPGSPVIQSMAHYALRMTKSYDVKSFMQHDRVIDDYKRVQILKAIDYIKDNGVPYVVVGMRSRILMEEQFGMTVDQQLYVEKYFDNKNDLNPIIDLPIEFPVDWQFYFNNYVLTSVDHTMTTTIGLGSRVLGRFKETVEYKEAIVRRDK